MSDPRDELEPAAHPAAENADHTEEGEDSPVGLFVLTAALGLLILLDWRTGGAPLPLPGLTWRPAFIAAVVGATRVTFASLAGLLEGAIGADLALAIATWAALAIGEPMAAAEVVFIAMTGESLEAITYARTHRALERLLELWPRTARIWVDGEEREVPVDRLAIGDIVVVRPGERVPVDGTIVDGRTSLDESSLTGESLPVDREVGDEALSGTLNLYGAIRVEAAKVGGETVLGQVVALVREAQRRRAPVQRTADLYAAWFLPVVLLCAAITFAATREWLRTVAVLVVACPCALVLATPAAVVAGIGRLARLGVLVRGGEALEAAARVHTVAFDKTGTLTTARLEVGEVVPFGEASPDEVLTWAAAAEGPSEHPLGKVIVEAARARGLNVPATTAFEAKPGRGVVAETAAGEVVVGGARLLQEVGIPLSEDQQAALEELAERGQTAVAVAVGGRVIGALGARDRLRDNARATVAALGGLEIRRVALLTGDRAAVAEVVAKRVGIEEVHAELLPADKADWIRTRRNAGEPVAMVGDGINDAPALAEADVGIAVAETGADIAAEAADVVLLGDPLAQLPLLVRMARQVLFTIRLSIIGFAFALNGVAVLLSAFGVLGPVQAAVFHQIGSLAVLLNSLRLLGFEPRPESLQARVTRGLRRLAELMLAVDIDAGVGWLASRWRAIGRSLLRLVVGLWLLSCVVPVGPDQVAVVRVLGRHVATWGPGVAIKPWWPIGRATRLRPAEVRTIEIGFQSVAKPTATVPQPGQYEWNSAHLTGAYRRLPEEALMLTGDENFVEVQAVLHYDVADPARYLFAAGDLRGVLAAHCETALRETVGRRTIDDVLTTGRHAVEREVAERLQQAVETHGLGVRILDLNLADVHPPLEVVPAFRAVASAYESKQQQINEAEAYANEQLALALGEAAAQVEAARAYRFGRAVRAVGDADRFRQREAGYRVGPGVTRARLRFEAIERVLTDRKKTILDPTVTARRTFWIVDRRVAQALGGLTGPSPLDALPPPLGESAETETAPATPSPPTGASPALPSAPPAPQETQP